jgi:cholinesterase
MHTNKITLIAAPGDPKRITLFGESAGGASVDYYSYAWTKDPIVNGFIPQSGTVSSGGRGAETDKTKPFPDWYALSEKLGCGGRESGEKTLECMRSKPAADIMKTVNAGKTGFGPMPDERVVFSDNKKRAEAGNFIKRVTLDPVDNTVITTNIITANACRQHRQRTRADSSDGRVLRQSTRNASRNE